MHYKVKQQHKQNKSNQYNNQILKYKINLNMKIMQQH